MEGRAREGSKMRKREDGERARERSALEGWGGVAGRTKDPPARGRPLVAKLEDQGQLSRKGAVRTSRPRAGHTPPIPRPPPPAPPPTVSPLFLPWTFIVSPGVQARLEHSPTLLSPPWQGRGAKISGLRPTDHPPCPGPGGWVVRMYSIILFWKSNASSFLILYKEETNKVCFCVYCLFIVL